MSESNIFYAWRFQFSLRTLVCVTFALGAVIVLSPSLYNYISIEPHFRNIRNQDRTTFQSQSDALDQEYETVESHSFKVLSSGRDRHMHLFLERIRDQGENEHLRVQLCKIFTYSATINKELGPTMLDVALTEDNGLELRCCAAHLVMRVERQYPGFLRLLMQTSDPASTDRRKHALSTILSTEAAEPAIELIKSVKEIARNCDQL
jgi:hypothetical protein